MGLLNHGSSKFGYTLLELIVVLALFAIVLSVAIPSVRIIFNTQEKKELMEFKRDIIFARNSAVVENGLYILNVSKKDNSYQIVKKDKRTVVIKEVKFSKGIRIVNNNFDSSISFLSTGAPNKGGTIKLSNKKNHNIELTILPATGKVNLYIDGK